jgi:hypothetical protein
LLVCRRNDSKFRAVVPDEAPRGATGAEGGDAGREEGMGLGEGAGRGGAGGAGAEAWPAAAVGTGSRSQEKRSVFRRLWRPCGPFTQER